MDINAFRIIKALSLLLALTLSSDCFKPSLPRFMNVILGGTPVSTTILCMDYVGTTASYSTFILGGQLNNRYPFLEYMYDEGGSEWVIYI